jgi:hypothetical protein
VLLSGEATGWLRSSLGWIILAKLYGLLVLYVLFLRIDLREGELGFLFVREGQLKEQRPPEIQEKFWERLAPYDGQYYLDIGARGYRVFSRGERGSSLLAPGNYAFFPLLPSVLRAARVLIPGHHLAAAIVLCIAASAAGVLVAAVLARRLGANGATCIALLLAFPTAVFQLVLYTEGPFLLLSALVLLFTVRGRLAPAALCALLGGLCRPQGILLALPLLAGFVLPRLRERPRDFRAAALGLAASALPFSGFAVLAAVSLRVAGSPLAFLSIQSSWGRSYGAGGLFEALASAAGYLGPPLDVLGLVFGLALLPVAWKRLPLALSLYATGMLVLPLLTGSLLSLGRFLSVSVPHFICLALVLEKRALARWAVLALMVALQTVAAGGLIGWHFVG